MKKATTICLSMLAFLFFATGIHAQVTNKFKSEIMVLIKADIQDIKGKIISKEQSATAYSSKLPLSGFEVSYAESILGSALTAKYMQKGSQEVMDQLALVILELPYVNADSKKDKKILGTGIFASDLKRKMKILDPAGKLILIITLKTDDQIFIEFMDK